MKVLMAGDVFRHQVDNATDLNSHVLMDQSFRLCPHARHVWIQTRLRNEHIDTLRKRSGLIETLYLSSENFDTRYPLNWDQCVLSRLRSLNILQRMDQPLNLRQILDPAACKALFPFTLRHVSITGVVLTSFFMDTLLTLTNLRHLDLIGCVIDTNLAANYVEKLGDLKHQPLLSPNLALCQRSNGPPVAEEPAPMPIMFTIPAAGATSAPVGVIIPTQAAVAPPASNTQQEQIREQSPGLDVAPAPTIPILPPVPAVPVMEANRTPTGDVAPAQPVAPLPAPTQSSLPQSAGSQENAAAAPAVVQYPPIPAHDRVQLPTQT
ncbi:hypothetical protein TELCIR_13616 [Teladorsagia circumcincta]|uniref:Uncharacterized protein n=1 Tax=Teladorsagia circumcincta TaxID=45464 RepID=A0A2G9U3D0_TELCI|nr:hypothetical protein TELCIR_13616 [Teladorsagia circumcincta]